MEFTPVILLHLGAALLALVLGGFMLWIRKGTFQHKLIGRGWVLLMGLTAISSFWIKTSGSYSWIHLISIGVLVSLALGVRAILQHRVAVHRRIMTMTYTGGLLIAGLFTLLPNRLLGHMLWGSLGVLSGTGA